ncbi:MAG: hypothetical protein A2036_01380 [Omnitrophica bacterium GWA2_50_21]|nr:MAG: hypothetical protein A2036_01380 [Omnitrophica bacterium GWA2_50_21]
MVAAVAEERLCRRKHFNGFPKLSIEFCLNAGGIKNINEIDAIVFYEKPVVKLFRIIEMMVRTWPLSFMTFVRKLPTFLTVKLPVFDVIQKNLPGYRGEILFSDHHLSHAASAFYCSPFDHAAILTMDGVGEWETTTIGEGNGREITLRRSISFPHSVGLLYSALTSYLGFEVNDGEWKVMGLAPYGEPVYFDQFKQLVDMRSDGSFQLNMRYFKHHFSARWSANHKAWEKLFGFPRRNPETKIEKHHEHLARSGQAVVEEMILGLARQARKESGSENLVIAGGVGLNSVANWKIEKEGIFKNVWIQPAAGDDGGALGAALLVSQMAYHDMPTSEMKHAYLGPSFSDDEILQFLTTEKISHTQMDEAALIGRVADLIASNKVVGWFRGAMEFGPRSLGGRSILANPANPQMKAIVNEKIKFREYFRPFAPSILAEYVGEFFDVQQNADMPFMLKVPKVRAEKRHLIAAVTHEDGTGRVQTVSKQTNPVYYRLLQAVMARTGTPVVLNTSFNVRGEPIVCTPQDAYHCFVKTGIDVLVLGNYLIEKNKGVSDVVPISSQKFNGVDGDADFAFGSENKQDLCSAIEGGASVAEETTQKVLSFYKELPFNYYSNSIDTAVELLKDNRIKAYPVLHRHFSKIVNARILDVGCGSGWFVNSCVHYYRHFTLGIDLNPVVLKQARQVAGLFPDYGKAEFIETNVFDFEPTDPFDVVNSLGVLHHIRDCHGAIKRCLQWVKKGGYFHLGLYHLYGRQPFLDHFLKMREHGATEQDLHNEFSRLNPDITDKIHMMSWFRDQVLHPYESQHTYDEIAQLLEQNGFKIEATSINHFKPNPDREKIKILERQCSKYAHDALCKKNQYYPGFFTVWARHE